MRTPLLIIEYCRRKNDSVVRRHPPPPPSPPQDRCIYFYTSISRDSRRVGRIIVAFLVIRSSTRTDRKKQFSAYSPKFPMQRKITCDSVKDFYCYIFNIDGLWSLSYGNITVLRTLSEFRYIRYKTFGHWEATDYQYLQTIPMPCVINLCSYFARLKAYAILSQPQITICQVKFSFYL